MKAFEQLNHFEKEQAVKLATYAIIDSILTGVCEITLVDPDNQEALLRILKVSTSREDVRLGTIMILNNKSIVREITKLALVAASESAYDDQGQPLMVKQNAHVV